MHHHTIQIIQPTRCNSFTSLLLDVHVWRNMFRASPRPSSKAHNCTRSLWLYRWREAAVALLVVVWQTTTNNAFIINIYHDARSSEYQKHSRTPLSPLCKSGRSGKAQSSECLPDWGPKFPSRWRSFILIVWKSAKLPNPPQFTTMSLKTNCLSNFSFIHSTVCHYVGCDTTDSFLFMARQSTAW
jgi:hypothetical protein